MRARRALLYVPGDDRHKMMKASTLGADCVCLDLEDGVAFNHKELARKTVLEGLDTINFSGSEVLVRVNGLSSGLTASDLVAILPGNPDGFFLPKVCSADEVIYIEKQLSEFERTEKKDGSFGLVLGIETALGLLNLNQICQASKRIQALVFGGEDYIADLGGMKTPSKMELFLPRSLIAVHAAAYDLQAIDMVCTDYKNEALLIEESKEGMALGYAGKQVIHPDQVGPVQNAFTPEPGAVAQAERIVRAFRTNLEMGKGAFSLDGKMIDLPVVKAAERLLARSTRM